MRVWKPSEKRSDFQSRLDYLDGSSNETDVVHRHLAVAGRGEREA